MIRLSLTMTDDERRKPRASGDDPVDALIEKNGSL